MNLDHMIFMLEIYIYIYVLDLFQQKTMERLLKKQESKSGKIVMKKSTLKKQTPAVKLIRTQDSTLLSFPVDVEFPLKPSKM